jgi:hypothetical protein
LLFLSGIHFYLTLPSNAFLDVSPDNKTTGYRVKLPNPSIWMAIGKSGYLTDVSSDCTFKFNCVDPQTVFDMLHSISTSKATGIDQIPGKILKLAAPAITQSITMLFNYSIVTESFPSEWKIAKVIPLHKSGPRNLLDNYRPISILPAISKVFEKILYKQLFNHLNANNLISKFQFGFRPLHSTADALLHSTNEWYSNMDDGLFNIAVFLDFMARNCGHGF